MTTSLDAACDTYAGMIRYMKSTIHTASRYTTRASCDQIGEALARRRVAATFRDGEEAHAYVRAGE